MRLCSRSLQRRLARRKPSARSAVTASMDGGSWSWDGGGRRQRRGGTFVILVRQPPSEIDVETTSTIEDGFGFVAEVVVLEAVTIGVLKYVTCTTRERLRLLLLLCAGVLVC